MRRDDEQPALSHRPAAPPMYRRRPARRFLRYLRRVVTGLVFLLFAEIFAVCMISALAQPRLGERGPEIDFWKMLLIGPLYFGVPLVLFMGFLGQDADDHSTDAADSGGDLSD